MPTLSAIASTATPPVSGGGSAQTAIRAQITRVEKERSDCVNCPSAQTLQGQQNIRSLDSQIKTLKEQLLAVRQPAAVQTVRNDRSPTTEPASTGRIDVYA